MLVIILKKDGKILNNEIKKKLIVGNNKESEYDLNSTNTNVKMIVAATKNSKPFLTNKFKNILFLWAIWVLELLKLYFFLKILYFLKILISLIKEKISLNVVIRFMSFETWSIPHLAR